MEKENKVEDKIEEAKIEAKLEEVIVEAKLEEAKIEAKVEEALIEAKVEEAELNGKKCCGKGFCKRNKCCKKKGMILAAVVLILLVAGSFAYRSYMQKVDIGPVAIRAKVQKFIDANVPAGTTATIKDVTKQGDLYQVTVTANKQDIPLYVTPDGKSLIQQVIDLDKASQPQQPADSSAQAAAPDKTTADQKTDVPDVKLFVMSYCPYGTQMEKGILPVINALGSKIKFTLEFVNYSMHNDISQNDRKELDENLRQYCIQKNQPTKLDTYLACFLQKGQGTEASCLASAGIDAAQISSCATQTDTQYNVTKDFNDQSSYQGGSFPKFEVDQDDNVKYGVQGSPTLVVNGTTVSPGRDSESLLKAVCSGFANQPKECTQALSATAPSPGFGNAAATGAPAASCATPQK